MNKIAVFDFLFDKYTYLSLLYVIYAFILSTVYFSLFITGISLSFGLLVIFIGVFVLIATLYMAVVIAKFEIAVARNILGIPEKEKDSTKLIPEGTSIFRVLVSGYAWKRLVYFILKFPLDVFIFSFSIGLLGLSFQFLFAPLLIDQYWYRDEFFECVVYYVGDPYVLSFFGILLLPFSLYIIKWFGEFYKLIIKTFLMK